MQESKKVVCMEFNLAENYKKCVERDKLQTGP